MKNVAILKSYGEKENINILYHSQHYNYIRELLKQSPTLNEVQLTILMKHSKRLHPMVQ